MPRVGKAFRLATQSVEPQQRYSLEEALAKAKEIAFAKFDEAVDIAINLGVNPKYADQMIRGACVLPHGTGKTARVLVFAKPEKVQEALDAGADFAGLEDLIAKIQGEGWLDFDKVIATPDVMGMVGRLGKVLGPRGLMPNPKVGTVTFDVDRAVKESKGGKIEFRVDKNGIIHSLIGRRSFTVEQLRDNANALIETLLRLRPSTAKGTYVKKITVSTTMGPGIKVDPVAAVAAVK